MSGTIKVLNVAEKPSVAKSVSGILSRNQALRVHNSRTASASGTPDKLDIKRTLEEEARRCQWLVLWLDCDREGENIAFEVINVCRAVNRHLTIRRARFSALIDREIHHAMQNLIDPNPWFSDAVDARQAIICFLSGYFMCFTLPRISCLNGRPLCCCFYIGTNVRGSAELCCSGTSFFLKVLCSTYVSDSYSDMCMGDMILLTHEIDLRIGASFTRFQTMLLRDKFVIDSATDDRNLVLSYGPCQFATLGFVVERYWEVQSHEPEEFWTINCSHRSDEGVATFNWMRGHLFDYTCAVIVYEMCVQEPTATVTKVQHKEKLKYPPYPLNTIELEKRASRYFRMSSEHTMKVAEELYQAGFISYPRTETDCFSSRTDLHAIVQEQQGHPDWGSYAQRLLDPETGLWRNPGSGGHDAQQNFLLGNMTLYELVVRHFLACVSQPAVGAETTVEIDIAGELFSASGRRNYLDVYRYESWGGSMIPTYTVGQQFAPASLTLDTGVTRPPPLLSEADLLSCMDKAGIGTDATMHDHIKKLLDRFYATKDSNTRFSPTNLGEALVMGYDDMGYELWKPNLRSMMEFDMKEVSVGNKSKDEVLATCLQQMKACFFDARLNKVKLLEAMAVFFERSNRAVGGDNYAAGEVVRQCDLCQESSMVLKKNRDGNFMVGCSGFPQCRNAIWLPGSILEAAVTSNICSSCNPGPVYLIQFKFRQIEIPPGFNANHLGCIGGCDDTLRQLIEICGTGSRMSARGRGPTTTSSNGQRSSNRHNGCVHCQQTGHSSNDCPSQFSRSRNSQSHTHSENGDPSVSCSTCEMPCVLRTANTANNRGRKFYSCPSQECNFFIWEDGVSNGNDGRSIPSTNCSASNSGRRGGRGQSGRNRSHAADTTFVSATGDPVSNRCYVCGDPSHFANVCPNRGM
ncbi:hypothetical protein ES332_D11G066800v1 [Gossypium tomentosum]|uniref:DNA topoisomerase n=1 Tax=Gossypium tomentosum TaxID=34277 RepID=A0A5D2IJ19_GOSTO|nr:hypothetical protein ES332_D11G066800v1 [Gossypium tomentosum]